jgi:putative transposase
VARQYAMSERHACRLVGVARSTKRYRVRRKDQDGELRERMRALALMRPRFGYRRLGALLAREGRKANHKRIYRLYRLEGLVVRRRRRKRLVRGTGMPIGRPQRGNERWSMDFVSDCTAGGRTIRALTLVDDFTRECLAIEVDTSLGGTRVRRILENVTGKRGRPQSIVVDNGPEFRGRALAAWSEQQRVRLQFIEPGKPTQNAFIESFNGRLREECLNANWFLSLADARRKIAAWRQDYNEARPHSSLGYLPPQRFAEMIAASGALQ